MMLRMSVPFGESTSGTCSLVLEYSLDIGVQICFSIALQYKYSSTTGSHLDYYVLPVLQYFDYTVRCPVPACQYQYFQKVIRRRGALEIRNTRTGVYSVLQYYYYHTVPECHHSGRRLDLISLIAQRSHCETRSKQNPGQQHNTAQHSTAATTRRPCCLTEVSVSAFALE